MNDHLQQPKQDSPLVGHPFSYTSGSLSHQDPGASATSANEFEEYEDEETLLPYLPLPSEPPQQPPEQTPLTPRVGLSRAGEVQGISTRKGPRKFVVFIVLTGVFLLLFIATADHTTQLVRTIYLLHNGISTQGVIIDTKSVGCPPSRHPVRAFVIEFTDTKGQVRVATLPCVYALNGSRGDSLSIVYLPDDPTVTGIPNQLNAILALEGMFTAFFVFLLLVYTTFLLSRDWV